MADRKKLIAGNWKMNKDRESALALAAGLAVGIAADIEDDVVIFPPAPFLSDAVAAVKGAAHAIGVGAQNLNEEPQGALTGEISAAMILSTGARWALVGHSERRQKFGETDATIAKKVAAALAAGLHPVLCVGETLAERQAGKTESIVLGQARAGLAGLTPRQIASVVIAYEPVWAIGTGVTATPEQGQEVHAALRQDLARLAGADVAAGMRILYGGSVVPGNVKALLSRPDIDGALVGGASLEADKFLAICHWSR